MVQAAQLIAEAEALRERLEQTLAACGLGGDRLQELIERLRQTLPQAELKRIEEAKWHLAPQLRRRPGTSDLSPLVGIRG